MVRCTEDALNGTDVKGKIVLCATPNSPTEEGPLALRGQAFQNVRNGGGSGLIFVQYTTDILQEFVGMPCVLVDIDTGKKITQYIKAGRYIFTSRILICNEHGTIYAISSDFDYRMITQLMGLTSLLSESF